jgi:hypothetical protein
MGSRRGEHRVGDPSRRSSRSERSCPRGALLEGTQTEAVDEFIEQSCWSEDVPRFVGGKGTPAERREALRAAYRAQNAKGDR